MLAWRDTFTGTHQGELMGIPPTGKRISVTGVHYGRARDGMAVEHWAGVDTLGMLQQLGIVPMMGGVVWASPDGLCFIGNSGFKLLTEDLISRREWQTNAPASFSSFEHDGKYIAFLYNGAFAALIFDLGSTPTLTTTTLATYGGYRDPKGDALFLAQPGNVLSKFDSGAPMELTWRSGVIKTPHDRPWSCARVVADAYPVTFSWITSSGTFTQTATSRYAFRLPPARPSAGPQRCRS